MDPLMPDCPFWRNMRKLKKKKEKEKRKRKNERERDIHYSNILMSST
jgi:hypothetical protein